MSFELDGILKIDLAVFGHKREDILRKIVP